MKHYGASKADLMVPTGDKKIDAMQKDIGNFEA